MTTAAALDRTYTPEEIDGWDEGGLYELDAQGRLVGRAMGVESDEIASIIDGVLGPFVRANRLGRVILGGTGLRIFPARPLRLPRGDVVFISRERLPHKTRGLLDVPPDLVVEVVSPGDKAEGLFAKVHEYLDAGVRLVWIVYPEARRIVVYRLDGSLDDLGPEATISGEAVIPGFEARVGGLFPDDWE